MRYSSGHMPASGTLRGIAGSPGVVLATVLVLETGSGRIPRRTILSTETMLELERYQEAVAEAQEQIAEVHRNTTSRLPAEHLKILEAYQAMLGDPMLAEAVRREVVDKNRNAEWAVELAVHQIAREFNKIDDPYLRERRHDVEFIGDRLQRSLAMSAPASGSSTRIPLSAAAKLKKPFNPLGARIAQPTVIVARDLSPADTAALLREPIVGFVTETGTRTSHTSIMARALEIPAVVGVAGILDVVRTGDTIIVDGIRGEVYVRPSEDTVDQARVRGNQHISRTRMLRMRLREPTTLACGTPVRLQANVELPAEAVLALEHGAEGIGLYRSEFMYMARKDLPSEEEQFELYKTIAQMAAPRPVTLRTFDIGADKHASSIKVPYEENPALGLRAIRLALREHNTFYTQLRAMIRASAFGNVRIMLPMVSSIAELREAKTMLMHAEADVDSQGFAHKPVPLGIMIEVPSAAVCADLFAREADFFSLGTNDLVQYTLAIDRSSQDLAALASPFDPAILRLIGTSVRAAQEAQISVSICGAMASDPLAVLLLVGFGLRDLSMESAAIAEIKEALRRVTLEECESLVRETLHLCTAREIELYVAERFAPRLSDVLTDATIDH